MPGPPESVPHAVLWRPRPLITLTVSATLQCRAKTCDDFPAKGCATCAADAPESCATCTQAGFIVQGGACVTPPTPGPDCTADATKGCATCSAADALKCATCTQAGYVVSTAGVVSGEALPCALLPCALLRRAAGCCHWLCSAIAGSRAAFPACSTPILCRLQCVPPAPAGQACPSSRSGGWWYGRHYGAWQTNSYRLCSSCDAAGKCLACTLPDWHVVDATTGRCRAKNCVERDAECASCGWKDRCAACKQPGWTVNWYTGKVGGSIEWQALARGGKHKRYWTAVRSQLCCPNLRCPAAAAQCAAPVAAPVPTCLAADANCAACKIWNPALCRVCKPGYDLAWTGKVSVPVDRRAGRA